jgi:hypothetical protein
MKRPLPVGGVPGKRTLLHVIPDLEYRIQLAGFGLTFW